MIAGYTMFLGRDSLPWPVLIVAGVAVAAAGAELMERVEFRPVRKASATTLLVTSVAVTSRSSTWRR